MSDNKPAAKVDVTKDWQATQSQQSAAKRLRIFAALAWIVAIGGEIAGIVLLRQHKFDHGNLPLLIGLLVGIAPFQILAALLYFCVRGEVVGMIVVFQPRDELRVRMGE